MTVVRPEIREIVEQSWQRSVAAGLSRDLQSAPVVLDDGALRDVRQTSRMSTALTTIEEVLAPAALDCDAVLAVFDDIGRLIWSSGSTSARRRAERIGFVEGSLWDERLAGTNAPGMALALNQPAQVRGREHYRESAQTFGCVAAPIRDPQTGYVAGVLDLTGRPGIVVPQTMAAVVATARLAGSLLLPAGVHVGNVPATTAARLTVRALGRDRALVTVQRPGGAQGPAFELSPRHSEIIALLTQHPEGMTGDELAVGIYPDEIGTSTLRAELTRLKVILGDSILGSRPYRLQAQVDADWRAATTAEDGWSYPGPLLPRSEAPGIEQIRDQVHYGVRQRVLDAGDLKQLLHWTRGVTDDYEAWQAIREVAPIGSQQRSLATGQLARLDNEFG